MACVRAVVLNATVTEPTGAGWLQLYATGRSKPGASSNLNFTSGRTVANSAIVSLGDSGLISFYSPVSTHLLADVFGYFTQ